MRHAPELIAELTELRTRARAAAELLQAQHLGALTAREARRIEALLQRPIGMITSRDAEAVLHLANRIIRDPASFSQSVHKPREPVCDSCDGVASQ